MAVRVDYVLAAHRLPPQQFSTRNCSLLIWQQDIDQGWRSPARDFYNAIKQSAGERTLDGITQYPVELGSGARHPIPDLRCSFDL